LLPYWQPWQLWCSLKKLQSFDPAQIVALLFISKRIEWVQYQHRLIALIFIGIFCVRVYPAFVLSSFRPILVLKGKFTSSGKGILLRKTLVIGQFCDHRGSYYRLSLYITNKVCE